MISEQQFSAVALPVLSFGLIVFMGFIIWDLGKKSKAGKFGMFVLFLALGAGFSGYIFKEVLLVFFSPS